MKKKKNLKLSFNKQKISELNRSTQKAVQGGATYMAGCSPASLDTKCQSFNQTGCYICHTNAGCTTSSFCG